MDFLMMATNENIYDSLRNAGYRWKSKGVKAKYNKRVETTSDSQDHSKFKDNPIFYGQINNQYEFLPFLLSIPSNLILSVINILF
jgi:hypothetical protein